MSVKGGTCADRRSIARFTQQENFDADGLSSIQRFGSYTNDVNQLTKRPLKTRTPSNGATCGDAWDRYQARRFRLQIERATTGSGRGFWASEAQALEVSDMAILDLSAEIPAMVE